MVLGSGPSAPDALPRALAETRNILTTNSGYMLLSGPKELPRYYWMSDIVAMQRHRKVASAMQEDGTKIVTGVHSVEKVRRHGIEPDVVIPISISAESPVFVRGKYTNARTSGGILTQIAVNLLAATRVLLVGMDGYRSSPQRVVVDTFDGVRGKPGLWDVTQNWQKPMLWSICSACPAVEFVWCGHPNYELPVLPNVTVIGGDN
jgi:hypothetical protein